MSHQGAQRGWRSAGSARVAGLLALLLVAGGCQDSSTAVGTALYVTAEFDPVLQLTQLQVAGEVEGDGGAISPTLLPQTPERLLRSGETFRVLLPDAPDGAWATLRVEGRSSATPRAEGTTRAQLRAGHEVDVTVRLTATSGPPDSGASCAPDCDGCCLEGQCVSTAFARCGANGQACAACDPDRASACAPEGFCACGTGSACTRPEVDRCVAGECRCGTGPACGLNETCLNGRCWCGTGGACGLGQACVGGECRCGEGNACDVGQACVNGRCGCTPESCPNGCCSSGRCMPGTAQNQCGRGGAACQQCRRECTADQTCR